jgi:hypothetical protein
MGRKRLHPKKAKTPKSPRAKMEGLAVRTLQDALWKGRDYPKYFYKYAHSAELIKIFKIMVNRPAYWQDGLIYEMAPHDKLHHVFGTDSRFIFTYEVMEDFILKVGEINEIEPIPADYPPSKLRKLYRGDIVLIRVDKRDPDLKMDMQVLTCGLFQDLSDDFRNFRLDSSDIAQFRKHLKLVDSDGIKEAYI